MRKKIWNEGMTLIEIAVVVCLISLVVALAGPSIINSFPRMRLSSQVSALQNDIQRARIKSIDLNTIYRIRFFLYSYPKADEYRGDFYDLSTKRWISDSEMTTIVINKDVDIAYIGNPGYKVGLYQMYFLADGTCITRNIYFTNKTGQKKRIDILRNTGFIKVHNGWD